MWNYEKRLQYPVNIKTPNAKLAQFISSQYGGPDGEIGASMRYLSQRFTAPNRMVAAVLNDVGTEELAHLEIVSTIVHQLTKDLSMEESENSVLGPYYIDHTVGIWPQSAGGVPFNACEFQSKGDPITDLFEDLAAEQKARSTYDNILRVVKNIPEVADPIRFLRAREVVHFQRFGEAKRTRWRVTKRAAEQNSRKSSKMVACGCLTLKSMVMGAHPLTARFLRFPQCGHPSSERSCHSVRQSKGRA